MTEKYWQFAGLWDGGKWIEPAFVTVKKDGKISAIANTAPPEVVIHESVAGWAIPGMPNAHSHAFQFAMAGMTESVTPDRRGDDFWTWRNVMYTLAGKVNPDQFQAIAAFTYAEMLRFGITSVAEFHYLHHDVNGVPFNNPAEMCERLSAAALETGIALTIIPVLFEQNTFDQPAIFEQKRFISKDFDSFIQISERAKNLEKSDSRIRLGIGAHSLRAARPENIKRIYNIATPQKPFHMHIAEQTQEVEQCCKHLGIRPVEWVLRNLDLDARCHLIHATHLSPDEIAGLARSEATVVLCPSTEANLGDGFFPLSEYWRLGGRFSIGTDSHVSLNPREDLRWLDYSQRLLAQKRNVLATDKAKDLPIESGEMLWREAWERGNLAVGNSVSNLDVGAYFDAVVIDGRHPSLKFGEPSTRMSRIVFGCNDLPFFRTIVSGKTVVENGKHCSHDRINEKYCRVIAALRK